MPATCSVASPQANLPTHDWTKRATFAATGVDMEAYGPLPQCTATAIFFRKDPMGLFVANQWEWCVAARPRRSAAPACHPPCDPRPPQVCDGQGRDQ